MFLIRSKTYRKLISYDHFVMNGSEKKNIELFVILKLRPFLLGSCHAVEILSLRDETDRQSGKMLNNIKQKSVDP